MSDQLLSSSSRSAAKIKLVIITLRSSNAVASNSKLSAFADDAVALAIGAGASERAPMCGRRCA